MLSVQNVRDIRKVAMQKIRRASRRLGVEFHATKERFATPNKGMTQAELNELYNKYENIMAGNFAINIGDGQFLNPITGEVYEDGYISEDEDEGEEFVGGTPVIDYIVQARNRLVGLPNTCPSYWYAINHFDMIVDTAIDRLGRSELNKWFRDHQQIFDNCYDKIKYALEKHDDSTSYFVDLALKEFEVEIYETI